MGVVGEGVGVVDSEHHFVDVDGGRDGFEKCCQVGLRVGGDQLGWMIGYGLYCGRYVVCGNKGHWIWWNFHHSWLGGWQGQLGGALEHLCVICERREVSLGVSGVWGHRTTQMREYEKRSKNRS